MIDGLSIESNYLILFTWLHGYTSLSGSSWSHITLSEANVQARSYRWSFLHKQLYVQLIRLLCYITRICCEQYIWINISSSPMHTSSLSLNNLLALDFDRHWLQWWFTWALRDHPRNPWWRVWWDLLFWLHQSPKYKAPSINVFHKVGSISLQL